MVKEDAELNVNMKVAVLILVCIPQTVGVGVC